MIILPSVKATLGEERLVIGGDPQPQCSASMCRFSGPLREQPRTTPSLHALYLPRAVEQHPLPWKGELPVLTRYSKPTHGPLSCQLHTACKT